MKIPLFAAAILCVTAAFSQTITVEGIVTDASDKSILSYVNIAIKNSSKGTYSDEKGRFHLQVQQPEAVIVFSFIGYEKQEIKVTQSTFLEVKLKPLTMSLDEVVVNPGENPANRVMKKVNELRDKHDPENLSTFQYKSYNKFVVAVDTKSDTSKYKKVRDTTLDIMDMLEEKMNLFLMESVTEKKYKKPGSYKEIVLGSRISGLKNAEYALLASEIQSFSFYSNYIKIMGKEYLSPIADGNTKKYLFVLQDTVQQNGESLYVIYYQPKKNKNFEGLTGLLYINTENYAVLKATAKIVEAGGFEGNVVQEYNKTGEDSYFPTVFTGDFILGGASIIVGTDSTGPIETYKPVAKAKTTLYDIKLEEFISKKEFDNIELDFAPGSTDKDEEFWKANRQDEFTSRDSMTYYVVDSVGNELNLDRKLEWVRIARTGNFAYGIFNFPLYHILRINRFEGVRLGLKAETNDRLSEYYSVGAYYAFGFKDRAGKYGVNGRLNFNKNKSAGMYANYSYDVSETGFHPVKQFDYVFEDWIRKLSVSVMDKVETRGAGFNFRLLRYITVEAGVEKTDKRVTTPYTFGDGNDQYYKFFNSIVSLRWAPGEKLVRMFGRLVPQESNKPVFHATFTKGLKTLEGQYDFLRVDFMAQHKFRIRNVGHTEWRLNTGATEGDVPYTEMYFGKAGLNYGYAPIVTPWAFEAMRYNEFFGRRYAALFIRHNFGSLLYKTKNFQPELVLVTNLFYSEFENNGKHKNFALRPADKGYFESGLQVDKLIKLGPVSLGTGLFYRYGPYAFTDPMENLAVKATIGVGF